MAYNHRKAAALDGKARRLLVLHRHRVFGPNGKCHERAIRRIQCLMAPHWLELRSIRKGERYARMGY